MNVQGTHSTGCSRILLCSVCGRDPGASIGGFLLSENPWFDTIRVLHWHPALANVPEMHAVCSRQHLRTLLAHWLTYADLKFTASDRYRLPTSNYVGMADRDQGGNFPTALVGELAVYRETLSRTWNGSGEALQAILSALFDGMIDEAPAEDPSELTLDVRSFNLTGTSVEDHQSYALHN